MKKLLNRLKVTEHKPRKTQVIPLVEMGGPSAPYPPSPNVTRGNCPHCQDGMWAKVEGTGTCRQCGATVLQSEMVHPDLPESAEFQESKGFDNSDAAIKSRLRKAQQLAKKAGIPGVTGIFNPEKDWWQAHLDTGGSIFGKSEAEVVQAAKEWSKRSGKLKEMTGDHDLGYHRMDDPEISPEVQGDVLTTDPITTETGRGEEDEKKAGVPLGISEKSVSQQADDLERKLKSLGATSAIVLPKSGEVSSLWPSEALAKKAAKHFKKAGLLIAKGYPNEVGGEWALVGSMWPKDGYGESTDLSERYSIRSPEWTIDLMAGSVTDSLEELVDDVRKEARSISKEFPDWRKKVKSLESAIVSALGKAHSAIEDQTYRTLEEATEGLEEDSTEGLEEDVKAAREKGLADAKLAAQQGYVDVLTATKGMNKQERTAYFKALKGIKDSVTIHPGACPVLFEEAMIEEALILEMRDPTIEYRGIRAAPQGKFGLTVDMDGMTYQYVPFTEGLDTEQLGDTFEALLSEHKGLALAWLRRNAIVQKED